MNVISSERRTARIVLLGCGAINSRVASLLRSRQSTATVVGVIVRHPGAVSREVAPGAVVMTDPADLAALAPDIVLEAASREAVRQWGAVALRAARRVVISSASAFADDDLLRDLKDTARQCGSRLVLSPGALAGVEALSAGARLALREVRHRIIKSPKSWGAAAQAHATSPDPAAPVVLFEGSAREAAKRYPLNANVTVVSALASIGLDRTVVELVCDPAITVNCHEIRAAGDFGSLMIRVENQPLPSNPKSSELAALALVRLAENEVADLVL